MTDPWTGEPPTRASTPLAAVAALGALGVLLGRTPASDRRHFWALTIVALVVNAAIVAVCVYGLIDLVQYLHSTTPCQRMGTCLGR